MFCDYSKTLNSFKTIEITYFFLIIIVLKYLEFYLKYGQKCVCVCVCFLCVQAHTVNYTHSPDTVYCHKLPKQSEINLADVF